MNVWYLTAIYTVAYRLRCVMDYDSELRLSCARTGDPIRGPCALKNDNEAKLDLAKAFEDEMEIELDQLLETQEHTWLGAGRQTNLRLHPPGLKNHLTFLLGLSRMFLSLSFDFPRGKTRSIEPKAEDDENIPTEMPRAKRESYDDDYFDSSEDEGIT